MIKPIIILVRPQLQENIGASARAMANFGFSDLRIVQPRDRKLSDKSYAMSSGADYILDKCQIFDDLESAVSDIHYLAATTSRHRELDKKVLLLQESGCKICENISIGISCGILFGAEATGLTNSELLLADHIIRIPTSENFSSINLAQSVLLFGYEYFKHKNKNINICKDNHQPASKQELYYFYEHLEDVLDKKGFFYPPEKKEATLTVLKNLFTKSSMNEQEVRMMRGVIKYLDKSI